jgi:hypothetical protein
MVGAVRFELTSAASGVFTKGVSQPHIYSSFSTFGGFVARKIDDRK